MSAAAPRRAQALTELILEVFRLNGRLLAAGDRLTADIGLTSARWQVIGAVALGGGALPVSTLARSMGLTRQAVQRTANELVREGFLAFDANPHHARAKLVVLTARGLTAYKAAGRRQAPWAERLGRNVRRPDLTTATAVLRTITGALESAERRDRARGMNAAGKKTTG